MLLLTLSLATTAPRNVRLQATPLGQRLVIGRNSYPTDQVGSQRFRFDGGIVGPTGNDVEQWQNKGAVKGTIDLAALTSDWLKDDSKWGGHAFANQMRYMASGGGGVSVDLAELVQTPNGDGLGILDFHWTGPSLVPVAAQFLVKLHRRPFKFEIVRFFSVTASTSRFAARARRLFQAHGKLFCIDGDKVDAIDWSGKVRSSLCSWNPQDMAEGLCANRWIIADHSGEAASSIVATDLKQGKSFSLLSFKYQNPPIFSPPTFTANCVSESSDYVLFWQHRNDTSEVSYFTLHVPDGRRHALAGMADMLAGPYAVNSEDENIKLYSAKTGKLLGTYPKPKK